MKNMTRTVTVPIPLAQQEVDVLRGIIAEYNLMWRMVVDWCREHQSANKTRLQKDMYRAIRENYPSMLSQFTSIALRAEDRTPSKRPGIRCSRHIGIRSQASL